MSSSSPFSSSNLPPYVAFDAGRQVAAGELAEVGLVLKRALEAGAAGPLMVIDNATGKPVDLPLQASDERLLDSARRQSASAGAMADAPATESRGRGRPKLGVVAREVTLLPRHWEWLAGEPGGASVALRKLVEAARRSPEGLKRRQHDRVYQFMSALGNHLPTFEEATRALFADELERVKSLTADWPADVRAHLLKLSANEGGVTSPE